MNRGIALLLQNKDAEAERDIRKALRLDDGLKPSVEQLVKNAMRQREMKPKQSEIVRREGVEEFVLRAIMYWNTLQLPGWIVSPE